MKYIIQITEMKKVSESERSAVESALMEKLGVEKALAEGRAGNSPYSLETAVYGPETARERGQRIALAAVCQSHDGAGHYKGRGRWRTVFIVAPKADGGFAVCDPGDRDSQEIGASGLFIRPWASHEAEESSRGLGLGAAAMAAALTEVGL